MHGETTSQSSMLMHICRSGGFTHLKIQNCTQVSIWHPYAPEQYFRVIVFVLLYGAIKGRQNGYNPGRPFFVP